MRTFFGFIQSALEKNPTLVRVLALLIVLYCFLVGLEMMGLAFKLFGRGLAETLIRSTSDPFVGLFIGILATTLVQSSSTTTSLVVGLVAAGGLTIPGAIPIIMGANIGTSVTNTIVSLAHVTRPVEFERAFAGATVHDFFNWMAVLLLLPLELATGYLADISRATTSALEGVGGLQLFNPVKAVVGPTAEFLSAALGDSGAVTLLVGVVLLMGSLKVLVDLLKAVLSGPAEELLHKTLFRSIPAAILAGTAVTVMVQSSSIATSTVVPLVGAGIITLGQLFPFTIGANIGTTITAMLAALSTGEPAAVTVAFSHLFFNLTASVIIYVPPPVRAVPMAMARAAGRLGAHSRTAAVAYILLMFYGVPLLMLLLSGALE